MGEVLGILEGFPLDDEESAGLITYMRTDSTSVSNSALEEARGYIQERFGAGYLPKSPRRFTNS